MRTKTQNLTRLKLVALILTTSLAGVAYADSDAKFCLDDLIANSEVSVRLLSDTAAGYPAGLLGIGLPALSDDPVADAQTWIELYSPAFGVQDPTSELQIQDILRISGRTVVVFEQFCQEIPVVNGVIRVMVDRDGSLRSITNSFQPVGDEQSITPLFGTDWALAQTLKDNQGIFSTPEGMTGDDVSRLVFFSPSGSEPVLAWEVHPPGLHLALNYRLFYDANTGDLLRSFNDIRYENLANVFEPSPGSSGSRSTNPARLRGRNDEDGYLAGDLISSRNCIVQGDTIDIGPMEVEMCSEIHVAQADDDGDFFYEPDFSNATDDLFAEAHMYYHAAEIYEYYQDIGLDEVDEIPLYTTVNFQIPGIMAGSSEALVPYDNAFFMPAGEVFGGYNREIDSIVFGQGTNVDFSYDGDVIYHEFGHAVFQAISSPGSFTFDQWGMSAAPGALNEGIADFFAGSFTEDSEIGEYVGPRIDPVASPARNIRDMDSNRTCPTAIQGEVHYDSTHFTAALWKIREHYIDELEGDDEDFGETVLLAVSLFSPEITFEGAATILLDELEDLDPALTTTINETFVYHGVTGCERIIDLGGGASQFKDYSYIYGPDSVRLTPWVPGFVQFRVHVAEDDQPANTIRFYYQYQGGSGMGSSAARVGFVVSYGEPIELTIRGNEVNGDWGQHFLASSTGGYGREALYQDFDGLDAGDYYFLPVSDNGGTGVMVQVRAEVSEMEEPVPEPDPEPVVEPTPDVGPTPDAGADSEISEDLLNDGQVDLNDNNGNTLRQDNDDDGCGCSLGRTQPHRLGLFLIVSILIGISSRRRRLNV